MFISKHEVEVRYAETDQMGVVYHANYLIWMDLGRTKLIKELGFSYKKLEEDGVLCPVLEASVKYKKPFRFGETATIHTWINEYNGIRIVYGYKIFTPNNEVGIEGTTSHVCVKNDSFKPINFKKHYPHWHEEYMKAMNK
ncbi:thioesterase family protein [Bacillus carboniphilus]|uniref:Thioesterase family protein n=1 Tax=Bacillus carboniphilus TaxID=86663 RepID=A0ABY9JVJ6_9BACI|nr:thioesterase family protein [Bacillus carboniphilus]WLR43432.1 thioesterase family protein [Bacillus carboniphilus]